MIIDDEMVDVVDERGKVLYPVLKTEAHQEGLLHKTVIAGVVNSKGQIMLVKQAPDRQEPGQYVSPMGGHVSAGETETEALKREIEEELGFKDFEHKKIGKIIFNREILNRKENHYFIVYEITVDTDPVLGPEAAGFKWFEIGELKRELRSNPKYFGDSYFFTLKKFYPELLI